MKKFIIVLLGTLFVSSHAFAAGYGDAGCGLGSMLFGDSPDKASQVLAFTTNGTGMQSFGISSGTSNCDATDGIILAEREGDLFVVANFEHLEKEMAAGEGEHVATLAGLLGCPSEKGVQFASYTQQNYQAIFASEQTTPGEMLRAVRAGISNHPELSASCRY
ncbi:MAG: DUF3015 domain-containing protein [bacterium]